MTSNPTPNILNSLNVFQETLENKDRIILDSNEILNLSSDETQDTIKNSPGYDSKQLENEMNSIDEFEKMHVRESSNSCDFSGASNPEISNSNFSKKLPLDEGLEFFYFNEKK